VCGQIHLTTFRATLTENSDPQLQPELTLESCIILPILVPSTLLTQKIALFDLLPSLGLLAQRILTAHAPSDSAVFSTDLTRLPHQLSKIVGRPISGCRIPLLQGATTRASSATVAILDI
jgi:hypothetical protein